MNCTAESLHGPKTHLTKFGYYGRAVHSTPLPKLPSVRENNVSCSCLMSAVRRPHWLALLGVSPWLAPENGSMLLLAKNDADRDGQAIRVAAALSALGRPAGSKTPTTTTTTHTPVHMKPSPVYSALHTHRYPASLSPRHVACSLHVWAPRAHGSDAGSAASQHNGPAQNVPDLTITDEAQYKSSIYR
jgi:hypothetical protein